MLRRHLIHSRLHLLSAPRSASPETHDLGPVFLCSCGHHAAGVHADGHDTLMSAPHNARKYRDMVRAKGA